MAAFAAVLTGLVLEIRQFRVLNVLDGRRWASKVKDDDVAPSGGPPDKTEGHKGHDG